MKKLSAMLAALLSVSMICAAPAFAAPAAAAPAAAQVPPASYAQAGTGGMTLEGVEIDSHLGAAHFTHSGSGSFVVKQTKADGTEAVLVNTTGKYDASVPMDTITPSKLQVTANGGWSLALEGGVYWGDTGQKYHIDEKCMSFQGTTPHFGTIAEAKGEGRIGWCQICSDGMGHWNAAYSGAPAAVTSKPTAVAKPAASAAPAKPAAVSSSTASQSQSVGKQIYRTKTGKKYHYKNPCGRGTYYPCTLEEAKAAGLGPCEKCVN